MRVFDNSLEVGENLLEFVDLRDLEQLPIERAETVPASWYHDERMLAFEIAEVFGASWQVVGRLESLAETGSVLVREIASESIVVTRGKDGLLRGFFNVCRHRAGPLATEDCQVSNFRCKYHGWTYTLDGKLIGVPDFEDVQEFNREDFGLRPVQVGEWSGFILVDISGSAPPLDELVAGIDARISPMNLRDLRFDKRYSYDVECNWKVYVDNFLEEYHVPHVHPELFKIYDFNEYSTEVAKWHSLQYSPLADDETMYRTAENSTAFYYFIWPNIMLNILPGRLQMNLVEPLGVSRCRVHFDYFYGTESADITDSSEQSDAAQKRKADQEFSHDVQLEDVGICELVQRGLSSRSYSRGRYSPKRERALYHFHALLRDLVKRQLPPGVE